MMRISIHLMITDSHSTHTHTDYYSTVKQQQPKLRA